MEADTETQKEKEEEKMKISRRQIQELIIKELNVPFDSLSPDVIDRVVSAVKTRTEKEGGAMGPDGVEDEVKKVTGDDEVTDQDIDSAAKKSGLTRHEKGDYVDPEGLAESKKK